jgi:hypothetical protein
MKSERTAVCEVVTRVGKNTQVNLTALEDQNTMLLNWSLQPGEHYTRGRRYKIVISEVDQHEGGDRNPQ